MSSAIVIAALYRFVRLDNFEELRQPLLQLMLDKQIRGTLLLAAEGINGTVAGKAEAVEQLLDYLQSNNCLTTCARTIDCVGSIASFQATIRYLFTGHELN
jgi:UPF0176 protein